MRLGLINAALVFIIGHILLVTVATVLFTAV
jgi:hypothetical protein